MIHVLVSGGGKMGRILIDGLGAEGDITVAGVVDKLASGKEFVSAAGALPLFADAGAALDATKPDVVVDFTNAAWTPELTQAALPRGVRPVIGTTGLSQAYVDGLAAECGERKLGGVIAANFAIGAVLMMHMARVAAQHFESAEIIELHHDQKVDAPSGTAIATARAMIEGRGGRPFGRNEPEATPVPGTRAGSIDGVSLHSVRLPGLVAHQEVIFGATGQTLTIRHDSNREAYVPGVLLAVREVMHRQELVVGLGALMGLDAGG
jgi:4-hydroxy-tetrahydrodipicolinate reductase